MASEREVVGRWVRCEFAWETSIWLPEPLCEACHRQLFLHYMGLESLETLLAEPLHGCLHTLAAVTVLDASLNGTAELVVRVGEEIGMNGWNHVLGFDGDGTCY